MHMADALVSPVVGGVMMIATIGATAYSIKRIRNYEDLERKIPLMGVLGAFVFAAQMINFTIPGTGSSGHLGGGVLLSAILGPYAAFLTMLSILIVQALFFGDGGLLALGCNAINMGFFACLIGYKLVYSKIIKKGHSKKRIFAASICGAVIGLQTGAFGVVLETLFSGITELPFSTFLLFMQPIHLAIGIIEGIVTGTVLNFVWNNRPEIFYDLKDRNEKNKISRKKLALYFLALALITGGVISWFASNNPDGLEWAIGKTFGEELLNRNEIIYNNLSMIQDKISILPDYNFKIKDSSYIVEKLGTTVAGVTGVMITSLIVIVSGYLIRKKKKCIKSMVD